MIRWGQLVVEVPDDVRAWLSGWSLLRIGRRAPAPGTSATYAGVSQLTQGSSFDATVTRAIWLEVTRPDGTTYRKPMLFQKSIERGLPGLALYFEAEVGDLDGWASRLSQEKTRQRVARATGTEARGTSVRGVLEIPRDGRSPDVASSEPRALTSAAMRDAFWRLLEMTERAKPLFERLPTDDHDLVKHLIDEAYAIGRRTAQAELGGTLGDTVEKNGRILRGAQRGGLKRGAQVAAAAEAWHAAFAVAATDAIRQHNGNLSQTELRDYMLAHWGAGFGTQRVPPNNLISIIRAGEKAGTISGRVASKPGPKPRIQKAKTGN